MPVTNQSIVVLLIAVLLAAVASQALAQPDTQPPVLNVDQVCRGIARHAAAPGERGGPDLSLGQCISSEQAIHQKLIRRWPTFAPADRTECVGEATAGGESSYTDLLTCLQMARDVRNYRSSAPIEGVMRPRVSGKLHAL
jgi:hypothetical protein